MAAATSLPDERAATPALPPCPDGRHGLRVVGYVHGRGRRGVERTGSVRDLPSTPGGRDCESPLLVECQRCNYRTMWACSNHRESRCRPCALRYRRRLRRVAESGMTSRSGVGYLGMLTLTAGGEGPHKRWSVAGPRGSRPDCGCHGEDLAEWNASHSRRWNHLRTLLTRAYPGLVFLRGVEVQARGALHDHAIVWSPVPLDLQQVQDFALRAGFGCVLDYAPCDPGSRKFAYYVSKYVTKACDSRDQVPWLKVDRATGEILSDRATYRTWSASRAWGLTMREVRAICAEYARRAAARELEDRVLVVAALLGAVPLVDEPPPE